MVASQALTWQGSVNPGYEELIGGLGGGYFATFFYSVDFSTEYVGLRHVNDPATLLDSAVLPSGLKWSHIWGYSNARGDIYLPRRTGTAVTFTRIAHTGHTLTLETAYSATATGFPRSWVSSDGSQAGIQNQYPGTGADMSVYDTSTGALAYSVDQASTAFDVARLPAADRFVVSNTASGDLELRDDTDTVLSAIAYPSLPSDFREYAWVTLTGGSLAALFVKSIGGLWEICTNQLDTAGDALAWAGAWTTTSTDWPTATTPQVEMAAWGTAMVVAPGFSGPASPEPYTMYWIDGASVAASAPDNVLSSEVYGVAGVSPTQTIVYSLNGDWSAWASPSTRPHYLRQRQSPRQSIRVDNDLLLRQRQRWT